MLRDEYRYRLVYVTRPYDGLVPYANYEIDALAMLSDGKQIVQLKGSDVWFMADRFKQYQYMMPFQTGDIAETLYDSVAYEGTDGGGFIYRGSCHKILDVNYEHQLVKIEDNIGVLRWLNAWRFMKSTKDVSPYIVRGLNVV